MLLLDFDGVMVDSIVEIAITAYNCYEKARATSPSELPPHYLDLYRTNAHLNLNAERIPLQARWCIEHLRNGGSPKTILSHEAFKEYIDANGGTSVAMSDEFFETRRWFMTTHTEQWLEVNRPFPIIWKALQGLPQSAMAILTNKNRDAVLQITSHYDLELDPKLLYTAEGGVRKTQNILKLDALLPGNSYLFLDDAFENLEVLPKVLPGRIDPLMAGWGYNTVSDREKARADGIPILTEEEFVENYICRS